ncbi:MAG: RNA pseudouridine synthase [Bacteroidota bacterium]|nr:RNA pseudouridine synthase [Bacteroidota bacterium]|tara:strand:+ start:44 stop:736 length:693 start_codon:yes stop_codon:yes gene_type:complete
MKTLSNSRNLDILFEDNHLIIINKKPGDIVQKDKTNDISLLEIVKEYLKRKYNKPGNVYLGLIHRIDRPTSGLVMFAKTSKALSRMNNMLKGKMIVKTYWAITKNKPEKESSQLVHWLKKNEKKNKSTHFSRETKNAKKAILDYTIIKELENYFLLEIIMGSGRHHQIRCQLQAIGCPIKGDLKYGAKRSNSDGSIDLHAKHLKFIHPVTKKEVNLNAPVRENKIWQSCV